MYERWWKGALEQRLPLSTSIIYGSADWSLSSFNTLRQVFYAIFLTDVVGLDARVASFTVVIGVIWDAINDPLVGAVSDRLRSSMGRRRPFLLWFAAPFGIAFLVQWWAPPWQSQAALAVHMTLAYMLADTLQSLVSVPYYALTPELTSDYDERTRLTTWRMAFNLLGAIAVAVCGPMIVASVASGGAPLRDGYLAVAAVFGVLAVPPFLVLFAAVRERPLQADVAEPSLVQSWRQVWANVPFRYFAGLYVLNWVTFDLVGLMIPFYVAHYLLSVPHVGTVGGGVTELPVASAMLGLLLVVALLALPLWTLLAERVGKRGAYATAMSAWVLVQLSIFAVAPGQVSAGLLIAALAGVSVGAAHSLPDAMLPDVIDWGELQTGARSEGVYYGARSLLRKLTGAAAVFIALQALGWSGYDGLAVEQPASALMAIRLLTGPVAVVLLLGAIAVALRYPLTRDAHRRVLAGLADRLQS